MDSSDGKVNRREFLQKGAVVPKMQVLLFSCFWLR